MIFYILLYYIILYHIILSYIILYHIIYYIILHYIYYIVLHYILRLRPCRRPPYMQEPTNLQCCQLWSMSIRCLKRDIMGVSLCWGWSGCYHQEECSLFACNNVHALLHVMWEYILFNALASTLGWRSLFFQWSRHGWNTSCGVPAFDLAFTYYSLLKCKAFSVTERMIFAFCQRNCPPALVHGQLRRLFFLSVDQTWMKWYLWSVVFFLHFYIISVVKRKAFKVTERRDVRFLPE